VNLNKVMMYGRVSSCYCVKWAAHNMSVTLQAVQTERRLHVNESAFHMTLNVLLHKRDFEFFPEFHILGSKNKIS